MVGVDKVELIYETRGIGYSLFYLRIWILRTRFVVAAASPQRLTRLLPPKTELTTRDDIRTTYSKMV